MLTRADANENLSETFTYDNLNRVASATVSETRAPAKTFTYDLIGNLLSKSDVGAYAYPLAGSALPHAVMSTSGGALTSTFTYDPNGNQTTGLGRSISYTSYNKPSSITQGSTTLFFSDDTDHQRFKQVSPEGTTLYFDAFGVHAELFVAGTSRWYDFIGAGGSMIGVRVLDSANTVTTRYFHTDNLGSIAVITDESGNVVERDSYDAWGKRRFPNGADDPSGSLTSQTTRGFTGQEELTDVSLVHLNGRVYDPVIGRMMSADPFVPDPMNGQAWNRYSYVINNPLALTDPNGYCFLGMCSWGKAISTFFNRTFGVLFRQVPILGTLFEIAAVGLCTILAAGNPACAAVASASAAFVAGVTSGSLGAALRAGLIAGATAMAFNAVGGITNVLETGDPDSFFTAHITPQPDTNPGAYAFNVAGHALVGCASAVASGGKCGPSALAGAVTSAAGPFVNKYGFTAGLVANTVLGGLASEVGGGKFANGAITGAFGYLFNACGSDRNGCLKWGLATGTTIGLYEGGAVTVGSGGVAAPVGAGLLGLDVVLGGAIGVISDIIGNAWGDYVENRHTPDQEALKDLVDDATNGGRRPLSVPDAETVLDWADEVGYPGVRAGPNDVSNPSNWAGGGGQPHIHMPGIGSGHIPVDDGVQPR